jgi:hypothetical protein
MTILVRITLGSMSIGRITLYIIEHDRIEHG